MLLVNDHQRVLILCRGLMSDIDRDIDRFLGQSDVNWSGAGRAAADDIEQVTGYLTAMRREILRMLATVGTQIRTPVADLLTPADQPEATDPDRIIESTQGPGGTRPDA